MHRQRAIGLLTCCALVSLSFPMPAQGAALSVRVQARREVRLERIRALLARTNVRRAARLARAEVQRPSVHPATTSLEALRGAILSLVNAERGKENLTPLTLNTFLTNAAQGYAEELAQGNFFSHESPSGVTPLDRIRNAGYFHPPCNCPQGYAIGENIAKGQPTTERVMQDWMQSEGHRANILNPHYKELGVGFYENHWVQTFGMVKQ